MIVRVGAPAGAAKSSSWVTTGRRRYLPAMGTKAERRAAREHVAAYHEARLAELIEYIAAAVDGYRTPERSTPKPATRRSAATTERPANCGNSAPPAAVEPTSR